MSGGQMLLYSSSAITLLVALIQTTASAFQHQSVLLPQQFTYGRYSVSFNMAAETNVDNTLQYNNPEQCYYKRSDGVWRPRKPLNNLFVGQRLFATRLPACDFVEGKTGPKVFLECGVGRIKAKKWIPVNGMMRLGRLTGKKNRMKESVVRKKLAKLPDDSFIEVYVSKINLDHASFEVCLNRADALEEGNRPRLIPASSLQTGQELFGYVKNITPYGVFIDVGANRKGLLHITRVAKHYDTYIDKEDGLKKVGLKQGSRVDVVVLSNDKKRLEFDFLPAVVESKEKEETNASSTSTEISSAYDDISEEEAAAWAAFGSNESHQYDITDEEAAMWAAYNPSGNESDDEDEHDEDKDIEDALGIGSW